MNTTEHNEKGARAKMLQTTANLSGQEIKSGENITVDRHNRFTDRYDVTADSGVKIQGVSPDNLDFTGNVIRLQIYVPFYSMKDVKTVSGGTAVETFKKTEVDATYATTFRGITLYQLETPIGIRIAEQHGALVGKDLDTVLKDIGGANEIVLQAQSEVCAENAAKAVLISNDEFFAAYCKTKTAQNG